jgi:hypothetical protein
MIDQIREQAARGIQFFSVLADTLIRQGGELALEESIAKRLEICQACEKFRADTNRCGVCGCRVRSAAVRDLVQNLGNKIAHKASSCPLGKWARETPSPTVEAGIPGSNR